jgi:tRNA threonylcarbamoyladenosine biosynthesis protein TsaB
LASILNIETSTTNCSVSVGKDGKLLSIREENHEHYSHSEKLHVFIDEAIKEAGIGFDELDAIAVGKGPGSYTGLRIGVSTAKGLCFALDKKLISVSTLAILAKQVKISNKETIVPMLDARRMEVYSAVFGPNGEQIRETRAEILDENSFSEYLEMGKVHFIGNGVKKFQALVSRPNAVFVEDGFPSAKEMLLLSEEKFKQNDFEDVAYFEPFYLKDFMAGK